MQRRINRWRNMFLVLGIFLAIIIINAMQQYSIVEGDYSIISTRILGIVPMLIGLALGFAYLKGQRNRTPIATIIISAVIGICFASSIGYLYTNGIWFDTVITGDNTILDYQTLIVLVWMIVGIIVGAMDR